MAEGHGGPRKPTNPAPVSGPGALSRRTDGKQPIMNLPNADYGENAAYVEQQQGAPMAQSQPLPQAPGGSGMAPGGMGVTPLSAGTSRPGEPVTAGAPSGPGPGPEALNLAPERDEDLKAQQASLAFLQFMANQPGSSWAARNMVRKMQAGQ